MDERPRVLVVEESAGAADALVRELELHGQDCRRARGVSEIQAALRDRDWDLVLAGAALSSLTVADVVAALATLRQRLVQRRHRDNMECLERMATGLACDINDILTIVLGYSEILLHKRRPAGPVFAGLKGIQQAGEKATALTRHLLAFSRKQSLKPQLLNLNDQLTEMEPVLRGLVGADHIKLKFDLEPRRLPVVIDRGQLEHAVMDLVTNAGEAMPGGGDLTIVTRHVSLDDSAGPPGLQPGPHALLEISDTGRGLDLETQAHLFEPYFIHRGSGTGLTLAAVHGFIIQSGGHIALLSKPGKGTTVCIHLPQGRD